MRRRKRKGTGDGAFLLVWAYLMVVSICAAPLIVHAVCRLLETQCPA